MNLFAKYLFSALAVLLTLNPSADAQVGDGTAQETGDVNARKTNELPKESLLDSGIIEFLAQFESRRNEAHEIRRAGDLAKAIELYKKNFDLAKGKFGDDDILVSVASDDLAHAFLLASSDAEAIRYRETSFEICKGLAPRVEVYLNRVPEARDSRKPIDTNDGALESQIQRVGGVSKLAPLLTGGLLFGLGGKFDKISVDTVDTAWRLSTHISDDSPTDSKCYLLNIMEVRYYSVSKLNLSRLCLQKLVDIAPKAQDKTILQNAVRRLAKLCLAQADFLSAVKYATAALTIDRRFEEKANSPSQQEDVFLLAKAAGGLQLYNDAIGHYSRLLDMYDELPPAPKVHLEAFEEYSSLLLSRGDFAQAYEGFSICKNRSEEIYGAESAQFAFNCQSLGWAAFKLQKIEEAERQINAALTLKTKLGIQNRDTYSMLSRLYSERGDKKRSRDFLRQSIDSSLAYLDRIIDLPLAEQIACLNDQSQTMLDQLLTECETADNDDLYNQILLCRGMLVDSLQARAKTTRLAKNDDLYQSLELDVQENRAKLVALRAASARVEGSEVFQQLEELEMSQRKLFEYLSTKYGKPVISKRSVGELRQHLAEGECLIDTYKFKQLDTGKIMYGAFLVRHVGSSQFIEIGESSAIEVLINDWIRAIRLNQKYSTVEKVADAPNDGFSSAEEGRLRTTRGIVALRMAGGKSQSEMHLRSQFIQALQPLTKVLTVSDSKLLICCDGELIRVPWSLALDKRFLVSELDNPKQLLDRSAIRSVNKSTDSLLLVGDVDFSSSGLPSLSASRDEVRRISETTSNFVDKPPKVLSQLDANKKNILDSITQSTFVHLATHGLFLSPLGDRALANYPQSVGWVFSQRSPLLDSAIFVAASNKSGLSDSEISADEILSLDLSNCQHVALSACETGLGESFRGQGVLGLRTAFAAAGTQTILMSLWPVDDAATGELMSEYYRLMFVKKLKPSAALAAAQSVVEKRWKNPYYWAGWVLVGSAW
ncbi:CHAT domain-containing protein [Candidatus Obscuribacterales bacterium]|nr:CHAT domain-containing protein [Candidatus Obscuribacterales bacterium]